MELEGGSVYIVTIYTHSHGTGGWGVYIVTLYIHSHGTGGWECIYRYIIYSLSWNWRVGVYISWYHIFTLMELEGGSVYIVTGYIHSNGTGGWECIYRYIIYPLSWNWRVGCIYRDIIYSLSWNWRVGVYISLHYIFTLMELEGGSVYIVMLYIHSHGTGGWECIYCNRIYSLSWSWRVRVCISWHYVFTPRELEWG